MPINIEQAIAFMMNRRGNVTYSMDYRDGPGSYDCSSSIYYALLSAGATSAGWAVNTEYEHDWLIKNGYELIAENSDWDAKRGDIFIWGRRGQSAGAAGHTGVFIDADHVIHCNWANNGISIDNYNQTAAASGWMYCYVYRLRQQEHAAAVEEPKNTKKVGQEDMLVMRSKSGKQGYVGIIGDSAFGIGNIDTVTQLQNAGAGHISVDDADFDRILRAVNLDGDKLTDIAKNLKLK